MESVILYGSQYGTTRRYAEALGRMSGLPVYNAQQKPDLAGCRLAVHLGGLYAGGVKGLKQTLQALPQDARLMIVTVGLADPADPANVANIRRSISLQVPPAVLARSQIFHLRGGIDYSKLNLMHKTMMSLLCSHAKKLPPEKQNAETRAMLETYGKQVDFVDESTLDPVLAAIREALS